jgi:hypothetical protein
MMSEVFDVIFKVYRIQATEDRNKNRKWELHLDLGID